MSIDIGTALVDEEHGLLLVGRPADRIDQYRSFFDQSGICVANLDHATRIIEANLEFTRQFGRSLADIRGLAFCELLHLSVRDKLGQQFTHLTDHQRARFEERVIAVRPDQTVLGGELTGIALHGEAGHVESIMVLVRPDREQRDDLLTGRKRLLSSMEARVLEGVAAGVSTVQLASMLYLSRGGVEYHVTMLLRKLKATNRPALVSKAYSMGIFRLGSWPPRILPDYVK
ncbi:helix-turn-helix transcriptional regulator [Streptosporangium sp. NBC_01755]|uniref:helix-turn-helix transcriptional regulator n=1 Tax=Streptosporangium sp. NBC_01755 TaxID=2975949 RepID=UPI002DD997D1|nr:LuxR C-terminal-related transcriptional regulator [Streptosporangium sp. NBC_01755]WSC99179.1 helix-turn-helix transcriptional regulator [Streptosporangium sp. NBC_01755]